MDREISKKTGKLKQKPRGIPFGIQKDPNDWTDKGDNSKFLRYAMESLKLPPIDISDEKQVEKRVFDYFGYCAENDRKPTMVGMGNWLGISRDTLWRWANGNSRADTHYEVVQRYVNIIHELWQDYMYNGKINPASGIFLGKNMFGYKDVQDVVITPKNPLGEALDEETLQKRIDSLPEMKDISEDLPDFPDM